jgi:transketolase
VSNSFVANSDFEWSDFDDEAVRYSRGLAIDAIENAGSGHPGASLSLTPLVYLIYEKLLVHSPMNPKWFGRDRFILSCGHASVTQYIQLFLGGGKLSLDDIKSFRALGSKTPGHPERNEEIGVEVNTGPLGQGFAMGVGMALASRYMSKTYIQEDNQTSEFFRNYVYVIASDGDLQEGISSEASSLAGLNELGNLIVFYDDNGITIDGPTSLSFKEDIQKRYESYNWFVVRVSKQSNGDIDPRSILNAVRRAKNQKLPAIIIVESIIGWPSPNFAGKNSVHGNLLGEQEADETKKLLGLDPAQTFYVPESVFQRTRMRSIRGAEHEKTWTLKLDHFKTLAPKYAEMAKKLLEPASDTLSFNNLKDHKFSGKISTRKASGSILMTLKAKNAEFFGGSADLTESNGLSVSNIFTGNPDFFSRALDAENQNSFAFGVREHAMSAIINGMAAYGYFHPYCATYLVFSDYQKPAIRLAAMMKLFATYIWTHDSLAVGSDGPTHQPIEHLAMLRSIPNFTVIRPADANEVKFAWKEILRRRMPTGIVLSRQDLPVLKETDDMYEDFSKGAYILAQSFNPKKPDIILIATGSEVQIAMQCHSELNSVDLGIRVVSMPCTSWFDEQGEEYKEEILPNEIKRRIVIEAATSFGWGKYVGLEGGYICADKFGESGDGNHLLEKFGFSEANCKKQIFEMIRKGY